MMRHASDDPFDKQKRMRIGRRQGIGYPLGQAEKKDGEVPRLPDNKAKVRELLGAMVYSGMAVILLAEADPNL